MALGDFEPWHTDTATTATTRYVVSDDTTTLDWSYMENITYYKDYSVLKSIPAIVFEKTKLETEDILLSGVIADLKRENNLLKKTTENLLKLRYGKEDE